VAASVGWVWGLGPALLSPFRPPRSACPTNARAPSVVCDGSNLLFIALIFGGLSFLEAQPNPAGKLDSFDPLGSSSSERV